ncbi:hypothetical protein HYN48_03515 [Flavobacterium magnum]|uniref:Uncharacterized protein n=1 Tax=Flavobacterium magnum TaxID=2162713 RepID=A0A2S0RCG3_9FLAO|nr:hypothetical protein HYN48_03515 [Flavobacterium magnum]
MGFPRAYYCKLMRKILPFPKNQQKKFYNPFSYQEKIYLCTEFQETKFKFTHYGIFEKNTP